MTFGAIGFLQPLLLTALVALPVIWWLLRFTPPRPTEVTFPPIRLLLGLHAKEETPARSPWWLTALRMLTAALIIIALAGPVLNPPKTAGPVKAKLLIVIDDSWAAASRWPQRQAMLASLLQQAEGHNQTVTILTTAEPSAVVEPLPPAKARAKAASLTPMPYAADRMQLAKVLEKALPDARDFDVVWLTDGIASVGITELATVLQRLSGGQGLSIVADAAGYEALGLSAHSNVEKGLIARISSPATAPRGGRVVALSSRGARLAETDFRLEGASSVEAVINLPLELRNQVARLEIDGETSAGATYLLDSRSLWQRFGVMSGESRESAQPLLSPTHYIERALAPFGEVIVTKTGNVEQGTQTLLERNPSVLLFANIGQLIGPTETHLRNWVEKGGMLIRFAGSRLEKGGDTLLPIPLREGGRTLGGALSWREPQKLAPFEETSPFYGLSIPEDVAVNRQVLADPTGQQLSDMQVWARLADGTPLVTAARLGEGWLVLFHISANSDWSSLPISGLFVEMLRRTTELSNISGEELGVSDNGNGKSPDTTVSGKQTAFLTPWRMLDGFGRLGTPPVTSNALPVNQPDIQPGPNHPPGYYGQPGHIRALNVIRPNADLKALDITKLGAQTMTYEARKPLLMMPWLLLAAFSLFAADALITLVMLSGGTLFARRASRAAGFVVIVGLAAVGILSAGHASAADGAAEFALKASLSTRLAYVITGDPATDQVSQQGLSGLSKVLNARTAIEPGDPMGVDVDRDELVFFPLLYWPVCADAKPLSDSTIAKIDAYMKQGGMIVFDTKDYQMPLGTGGGFGHSPALATLLGKLDIPRLEPISESHILTKSFYLLRGFPGRWDGGTLWVEAQGTPDESGERRALKSDGVSSILITSNDFAGAWAMDDNTQPIYATVPGGEMQREMAFRVGVNIVMYALTGNYKADQVHVPALLERLGQ
jgi:hypothetical protein